VTAGPSSEPRVEGAATAATVAAGEDVEGLEASVFRHRDLAVTLLAAPLLALPADPGAWRPVLLALGALLAAAGAGIRLWSIRHLGKRARSQCLHAARLVVEGPFHLCRNPIYLGNALAFAGLALMAGPLAYAPVATALLGLVYGAVVRAEERELRRTFGVDYEAYRLAVPRLVPRLRRLDRRALFPPGERVPWTEVLWRELSLVFLVPGAVALAAWKPGFHDLLRSLLPRPLQPFLGPALAALVLGAAAVSAARAVAKSRAKAERRAARRATAALALDGAGDAAPRPAPASLASSSPLPPGGG